MPTAQWWAALEQYYPAMVPFYDAKYKFLAAISPIHCRRDDMVEVAGAYMRLAMTKQKPVHRDWIAPMLREFGIEADANDLLYDLDEKFGDVLNWRAGQWRSDVVRMDAFLESELA